MTKLINGYKSSCKLVKDRIGELLAQRRSLMVQGRSDLIKELDLDRRINLLYIEYRDMREIIINLTAYMKAIKLQKL